MKHTKSILGSESKSITKALLGTGPGGRTHPLWLRIRNALLLKLAGDSTVIINARMIRPRGRQALVHAQDDNLLINSICAGCAFVDIKAMPKLEWEVTEE